MTDEHTNALKAVGSAKKILDVMDAMPQGKMVILHNAATDDLTFLGRAQIADDPALYENALAAGSVPFAFFTLSAFDNPNGPAVESKFAPWCPFTHAELQAQITAWCGGRRALPGNRQQHSRF